jgi:hypothetical protein
MAVSSLLTPTTVFDSDLADIHFQYARRNFLDVAVSKGIKAWSFIFNQRNHANEAWQGGELLSHHNIIFAHRLTVLHTAETPYVFMQLSPSDTSLYNLSKQVVAYWFVSF